MEDHDVGPIAAATGKGRVEPALHDRWTLLLAVVAVLAAHASVEFRYGMQVLNGELIGPDS